MKEKKGIIIAAVLPVLFVREQQSFMENSVRQEKREAKNVTVVVVHGDQSEQTFEYHTDAAYLGEVLEAEQLVEGEMGPYGFIHHCRGRREG